MTDEKKVMDILYSGDVLVSSENLKMTESKKDKL